MIETPIRFENTRELPVAQTAPVQWVVKDEDHSLVERAQLGDLDAFNELVLRYQDQVYRQAFWILGDEDKAEDAAMESFFKAYRKLNTYHGPSFRAWILRITTNYCYDQIRHQKIHQVFSLDYLFENTEEDTDHSPWLRDDQPSPEQLVEQSDLVAEINHSLLALSPAYRTPIILVDIQELDYIEAAAIMGLNLGTFKSRLSRARAQLARSLSPLAGSIC